MAMILVFQVQLEPVSLWSITLNLKVLKQHLVNWFFVRFYFQVSAWFFTTFTVSGLKDKIHYVESLQQLFTVIPPEQMDLPPFVLEYDARVSDCLWPWVSALRAVLVLLLFCSARALRRLTAHLKNEEKRKGSWRVCVVLWVMILWIFCLHQPKQRAWLRRLLSH